MSLAIFKLKSARLQMMISIICATLVIVFSFWYFMTKQKEYISVTKEYMELSQSKMALIQQWGMEIEKISTYSSLDENLNLYARERARSAINETITRLSKPDILFPSAPKSIETLKKVSHDILGNSIKNNTNDQYDLAQTIANNLDLIKQTGIQFTSEVIDSRAAKSELEIHKLEKTRTITVTLGIISLLVLLYVLYRVFRFAEYLKESSKAQLRLNHQFQHTTDQLEALNWVLQNSSKVYNEISGNISEKQIAKNTLSVLKEVLESPAAAIYIRRQDSNELTLRDSYGLNKGEILKKIIIGDGIAGATAESLKYQILEITDLRQVKLSSATIVELPAKAIIYPIIFEDYCIGILEVFSNFPKEKEVIILDFLARATRAVGSSIRSRQSQSLVEDLLSETQHQTEELEAQQEELRITNEELVYKTNLLESSEEELRVQQEELSQTNKELNHKAEELEKRNDELKIAQQHVEQKIAEVELASRYKSEFMANMSHELRTPLNSILILAKLLRDNKQQNLTEDQVKYSSVIYNAGSDLLQLINELLDLAKIESGKVELDYKSISSVNFAKNIEALFEEIADEKNIEFTINIDDAPKQFVSDDYRLEQVIKNFLSNAFKFTKNNGKISLNINHIQNNLHFVVSDSGIGISKEKQAVIFEAFRQEDGSTSRKFGGTGLGLSISKEIASLLGGRILLESEPNVGSKFTLIIPYKESTSTEVETATPNRIPKEELKTNKFSYQNLPEPFETTSVSNSSSEDKVILIIEDDVNFSEILKGFAEGYGFKVIQAYDGENGINLTKSELPDAIILDVMLPIADGWEVLRTLKNMDETKHIPIHMMSAASFDKKEFLEGGAIGFMSKPVSESSIQSAFENIKINLNEDLKKILLIEDQEFQSDLIKKSFAEQHINVIQAFTIESGLKKLEQDGNFDCIILDVKLPDGSGLEMLDLIKSNPKFEKMPVIINTAYDLTAEQMERIMRHTQSMVLKSSKSNTRLTDEVNLFLNKLTEPSYSPIKSQKRMLSDKPSNKNTSTNLEGKCVLIADDDMRNIFALTSSLQHYNMQIEIANNGKEAVDIASDPNLQIDIILMDIMMPEMDGYEAIQEIRKTKKNTEIPIIAVTAKAMKGDKEKSIELGANDYVSKPIDIDKLISLMQVWLS